MAHFHSPRVVSDSLVMYYDTGNALKSYRGEPTTNLATDTPSQGGWGGTYEVLNSSTKAFRFIINNFAANPGAGWRSFTWDLRAYTGQSVTISATVEVPATSPGTFAWIMMGQGNTYTNNSGAGGYLGYSATSERVYKSDTVKERITWSGIIGNTGTANQPSGHIGFTVWYNNGTPGINSYVEVSNVQIEIKSHATPFVNGTRSVTEGLLDMMGNHSFNLTNVSFDSNAKPTWDGTNDYIGMTRRQYLVSEPWTTELIFKPTDGAHTSWNGLFGGSLSQGGYWMFHSSGNLTYYEGYDGTTRITYRPWTKANTFTTGNYHHLVITYTPTSSTTGTYTLYYNGGQKTDSFGWTFGWAYSLDMQFIGAGDGRFGTNDIHHFKQYNRVLTVQEVAQNYQAVKSRFGI